MNYRGHSDEIRELWLELQSRTAYSFFLSWGWVSVWLDTIPENFNVDFVLARKNGEPYSCFFIGVKKGLHHWLFYKARAYLNETGDDEIDELTIEYNMVLGTMEKADWLCMLSDPQFTDIEELCFSNITKQTYAQLDFGNNYQIKDCQQKPSYYVDLSEVRESGRSYLELLSSSKRAQIKKSLAYYEEGGPVSIREARSALEALAFLEKLKELHQMQWTARGAPGAFASDLFNRFHRQLVGERFTTGEIQLLELSNSGKSIGYLYNFIHGNKVYYYQSGFCYEINNIARPGIVCHYLAIEHNLAKGRDIYSFLAGEVQYKRSLSTHSDKLYTVVAVRNNLKWQLEKRLRAAKRKFVA
jgi:CelD/BcsL family acetyltransferase involved in cellulose biosynthesis